MYINLFFTFAYFFFVSVRTFDTIKYDFDYLAESPSPSLFGAGPVKNTLYNFDYLAESPPLPFLLSLVFFSEIPSDSSIVENQVFLKLRKSSIITRQVGDAVNFHTFYCLRKLERTNFKEGASTSLDFPSPYNISLFQLSLENMYQFHLIKFHHQYAHFWEAIFCQFLQSSFF